MATFDDAKMGWEIFRLADYSLTRDELNARLLARGMSPISDRTYRHYGKLRRYGYRDYVSINQLDVKTLKDLLWDRSVRNRYSTIEDSVQVNILTSFKQEDITFSGRTVALNPATVVCRVTDDVALELIETSEFQRHLKSDRVNIYFPTAEQAYVAKAEQVTLHLGESYATVSFGFISLAPVERVIQRVILPSIELRVQVVLSDDAPLLSEMVRKLYWLFQALETSKILCDESLADLGLSDQYAVPSVRIKSLSMKSPLQVTVAVALPTAWLLVKIVNGVMKARTEYYEGNNRRESARLRKMQNDMLERSPEIVRESLLRILPSGASDLSLRDESEEKSKRWAELAKKQLLPSVEELVDADSGEVHIELNTAIAGDSKDN